MEETKPTIFMLSGYLQSGKDTVADYLVDEYNFTRFAFADALKDQVAEKYNIDRTLMDSSDGKKSKTSSGETVRQILIKHGLEMRTIDPDYWIKNIISSIDKSENKQGFYVISDWRYPNEYDQVYKYFGDIVKTIRINRWDTIPLQDASETGLDNLDFDYVIENKGTLEELHISLEKVVNMV
jgi:dephospho-CoA kinase